MSAARVRDRVPKLALQSLRLQISEKKLERDDERRTDHLRVTAGCQQPSIHYALRREPWMPVCYTGNDGELVGPHA